MIYIYLIFHLYRSSSKGYPMIPVLSRIKLEGKVPCTKALHCLKQRSLGHFQLSILSRWSLSPAKCYGPLRGFFGEGVVVDITTPTYSHGVFSCFFPTFTLKTWNTLGIRFFCVFLFAFIASPLRWAKIWSLERSPDLWELLSVAESAPRALVGFGYCGILRKTARPCETITQNGQSCFPEKSVFERRAYFSYMSMSLGKLQLASLRQSHLHVTSTPMELLFGFWQDAWMHQSIWELEGLDSKLWFWLSGKYDRVQKRRKKSSNWLLHHSKSILQLCTLFCCTEKWLLKQHHNECCNTANEWYAIYRML